MWCVDIKAKAVPNPSEPLGTEKSALIPPGCRGNTPIRADYAALPRIGAFLRPEKGAIFCGSAIICAQKIAGCEVIT
jgi:hypothetical protein